MSATNLPVPLTRFLGRERELAEVVDLFSRQEIRLVTLTGPGGTGKTRLGLQVAAELSESFPEGIWWIPLSSLRDPRLVLESAALALGASRILRDYVGDKRLLLLFDNFEHLVEAASDLAGLLTECPNLRLLVTSRQTLRIAGEYEYPVLELADDEATRLFCERAHIEPTAVISELCQGLDRMPLAIELAAARAKILSPRQLLDRLNDRLDLLKGGRDADPRQQTLRATMEWSYDLLNSVEQELFARLTVFSGGWILEAAEHVCDADIDTLQSLLDKSLIRRREGRFGMLETIREFAAQRLHQNGVGRWEERHAQWFAELAERCAGGVARPPSEWHLAELAQERENIRRALAWAWATGRSDFGLRLGSACARYWGSTGQFRSALTWLDEALPRVPEANPALQLRALEAAGWIAFYVVADTDAADRHWERALEVAEELDDDEMITLLLDRRAFGMEVRGDTLGAMELYERNLAVHHERGDRRREALSLHYLGELHRDAGDHDHAAELFEAALVIERELRSTYDLENTLHSLGDLALDRGDSGTAARYYRESLEMAVAAGNQRGISYCVAGLACVHAAQLRPHDAARLWGAVVAAEEKLGFRLLGSERHRYESKIGSLDATPAYAAGRELTVEDAVSLALGRPGSRVSLPAEPIADGTLRLEGEYWTVVYRGGLSRIRDSKGIRVLATLLLEPGRPLPALDLERLNAFGDGAMARAVAAGDAGELIDDEARRAYRARIAELREAIDGAAGLGASDRIGVMQEEIDLITRELGRALGLGGRSRLAGSIPERARVNVTRAVKSAIRRIAAVDADLGAHLGATVHTGSACVYTPDPRSPIQWLISTGDVPSG